MHDVEYVTPLYDFSTARSSVVDTCDVPQNRKRGRPRRQPASGSAGAVVDDDDMHDSGNVLVDSLETYKVEEIDERELKRRSHQQICAFPICV